MILDKPKIFETLKEASFVLFISLVQTFIWLELVRLLILDARSHKALLYGLEIFIFLFFYLIIIGMFFTSAYIIYYFSKSRKSYDFIKKSEWFLNLLPIASFITFNLLISIFIFQPVYGNSALGKLIQHFISP